ncbi:MAG TPA: hypothetical protein VHE81_08660 [Lacipirellulaceae bacterium]|nr:hypothetical protein [Lacipirellulaceae bacterium]
MMPPLKTDPKYGYYPWWPQDGNDWLHPDDVAIARAMIPSNRVFRRNGVDGEYLLMHYGSVTLRVRRTLWREVPHEGFEIGDWVEVLSRGMRNEPRTGIIREMFWDERDRATRYQISENNEPVEDLYAREDLRPVVPV